MGTTRLLGVALGLCLGGCGAAADEDFTDVTFGAVALGGAQITLNGQDVSLPATGRARFALRPAMQSVTVSLNVSMGARSMFVPPVCLPGPEAAPDPITSIQLDLRRRVSDGECVVITTTVRWSSGRTFAAPWNAAEYDDAPCGVFVTR